MTALKGTTGVNVDALLTQAKSLTKEYLTQEATMKELQKTLEPEAQDPGPVEYNVVEVGGKIQAEAQKKKAPIDWDRFQVLRTATPEELKIAIAKFKELDQLDMAFSKMTKGLGELATGMDIEALDTWDARIMFYVRAEMLDLIEHVRKGLVAAGDCPATANFPTAQLDKLEAQLKDDMKSLIGEVGQIVRLPPRDRSGYAAKKGADPALHQLPASEAVNSDRVKTLEAAAKSLADTLHMPKLERALLDTANKIHPGSRNEFAKYLGAFAILADEAVHAPNYQAHPRAEGAGHRQSYRAREELGVFVRDKKTKKEHLSEKDVKRREGSRLNIGEALEELGYARDPLAEMKSQLTKLFLREIGIQPDVSRDWNVKPEAVDEALRGEAFLPLRAINERAPIWIGKEHAHEMRGVVQQVTQSVVEGRFEEWRATHAVSEEQLALLTPEQRKIWLEGVSVTHEIVDKKGKKHVFETSEPRGFERFWATKVGGPSHGFDTMTQCVVPLLTNARDDTIVVKDPRWANYAGRTYLRLIQRDDTREPVLFMESSHRDFPYPGSQVETEKALVKHAIAKAKAMGLQLVLSGRTDQVVEELGLKGEWRDGQYYLARSLINEATSVFGPHDWIQKEGETCGTSSPVNFYVDLRG